jgi:hypothetical protein
MVVSTVLASREIWERAQRLRLGLVIGRLDDAFIPGSGKSNLNREKYSPLGRGYRF